MKRVVRAGSPEIVKIGGDSSPCSAETSFRELDDVFLQTQTRIWLGEVLHIRFSEETTIADLLADGELLFQVSKTVWKMLLKKHAELKHSKVYIYERTSFGKGDGRYMPYPKVDSFLKICQILGLTGVDLFSPSDVVERRDVRRVCMCIRSLSKKARSKNLNVPDFDIVTYTIAMPTDWVGGICRNLEQSQYSASNSNGFSSPSMDSREFYRQRSPGGQNTRHYDSHSDSDEAESNFTEFEFQSPFDAASSSNIIQQDSLEENSIDDGEIDVTHKIIIRNSIDGLKVAGVGANFSNLEQVTRPLRNLDNSIEINNIDTSAYKKISSTYDENSGHVMDDPSAADAEGSFRHFNPTIWSKDLENSLPKCLFSDNDTSVDHPKEESVKALLDPLVKAQTIIYRTEDDGMKSVYIESSNKKNSLEIQGIKHEMTPPKASEVALHQKQMDASCFSDGNKENSITTIQADASYSSLDLDEKDMKIGFKRKAVDEDEIAQAQSISSSISLENKYSSNHSSPNTFSFSLVHSTVEEHSDSITIISTNDQVNTLGKEAFDINEASEFVKNEKFLLGGSCDTDQIADFDGEFPKMSSTRTSSSTTGIELSALVTRDDPPLDTDWHTVSFSKPASIKNDQVSFVHLDTLSDSLNMQCESDRFIDILTLDYNGNIPVKPHICCNKGGGILEEGDNLDVSTCDVEMDADEKVKNSIMAIMHEDMTVNGPSICKSKMCRSTSLSVSEDYTDKLSSDDCSHLEGSSVPQINLPYTDFKETWEQVDPPIGNGASGKEGSWSLKACEDDRIQMHVLKKTEEMNASDGSASISNPIKAGVSKEMFSTVANIEQGVNANKPGDVPLIDGDYFRIEKEPEEREMEPQPKLKPSMKAKQEVKAKKLLKSIAGAMTLLGAIFMFHHVRRKRGKEKKIEPIPSKQTRNPSQGISIPVAPEKTRNASQELLAAPKRVDVVKPAVLYPGERLMF